MLERERSDHNDQLELVRREHNNQLEQVRREHNTQLEQVRRYSLRHIYDLVLEYQVDSFFSFAFLASSALHFFYR